MKKLIAVFLICFGFGLFAQSPRQTMFWQDVERSYKVLSPSDYDGTTSLPMLVFLHGLGDNIDNNAALYQRIADEFGWFVALPQALDASIDFMGQMIEMGPMWNSGMGVSFGAITIAPNSNVDDIGFINAMIDTIVSSNNVAQNQIFVSGFSMGGFMTHRMAIENSERFKAFAAVSGMIPKTMANTQPSQAVKLLHIHGTADNVVSYDGATSVIEGMPNLSVGLTVEQTVNFWIENNELDNTPLIDSLEDRKDDGLRFIRYSYLGNDAAKEVRLLKIIGGEHIPYVDANLYDMDCLAEIFAFFTNDRTNVGLETVNNNVVKLFPNPASNRLFLIADKDMRIEIINISGLVVMTADIEEGVNTLDVAHLSKGFYVLKNNFGKSEKLIIE